MPLWFYGVHWTEIRAGNIREWLGWSLFGTTLDQVAEHDVRLREQGGRGETRGEFIEWCLKLVCNRAGHAIPEGHNEKVKSIRLTLDPVAVRSRPLIFYLVLWLASWYTRRRITKQGFHFGAVKRRGGLEYAVRIPAGWDPKDESTRPLVFCHGLGVGPSLPLPL